MEYALYRQWYEEVVYIFFFFFYSRNFQQNVIRGTGKLEIETFDVVIIIIYRIAVRAYRQSDRRTCRRTGQTSYRPSVVRTHGENRKKKRILRDESARNTPADRAVNTVLSHTNTVWRHARITVCNALVVTYRTAFLNPRGVRKKVWRVTRKINKSVTAEIWNLMRLKRVFYIV